jgi:hypothetical protein
MIRRDFLRGGVTATLGRAALALTALNGERTATEEPIKVGADVPDERRLAD